MKNTDEICYWTKHKTGTKVWYKSGFTDNKWELKEKVYWDGLGIYIVDDEWAELRKAQIDGKQLQTLQGIWRDETLTYKSLNGVGQPKHWRIKPEPKLMEQLLASEALYGFAGWITTRDKEVIASARHDAGIWAKLVDKFIKANNLEKPRDGWEKNLIHPKEPIYEWQSSEIETLKD